MVVVEDEMIEEELDEEEIDKADVQVLQRKQYELFCDRLHDKK